MNVAATLALTVKPHEVKVRVISDQKPLETFTKSDSSGNMATCFSIENDPHPEIQERAHLQLGRDKISSKNCWKSRARASSGSCIHPDFLADFPVTDFLVDSDRGVVVRSHEESCGVGPLQSFMSDS